MKSYLDIIILKQSRTGLQVSAFDKIVRFQKWQRDRFRASVTERERERERERELVRESIVYERQIL